MMISKQTLFAILLVLATSLSLGCERKEEGPSPTDPPWKPAGTEANITGRVSFTGVDAMPATPAPAKMDMSQDPACLGSGDSVSDEVMTKDGKLRNVFIYVKSGLPKVSFEVPATEVVLDQKGCKFSPRVLGLQAGQTLSISNSDQTNHNVHPVPKANREWNQSQMAGQGPIRRKFTSVEGLFPVKCNMHPWMLAWISVLPHPFFAVSGQDGAYTIKGLPPGEYEVVAWHEKFGARTGKALVKPNTDANLDFSFDGSATKAEGHTGTLKMQPALVLP